MYDIVSKDGTSFVYGEVSGCYLGDEATVYAKPDSGYHFVGWYLADGAWPANGNNKYIGETLSTDTSYTYKPNAENRLICAVFAKGEEPAPEPAKPAADDSTKASKTKASATPATGDALPIVPVALIAVSGIMVLAAACRFRKSVR